MLAGKCRLKMGATPAVGLAFLLWAFCLPVPAQDPAAPGIADLPLDQWLAGGDREEIPWKVRVISKGLSFEQRLLVGMEVEISSRSLASRGVGNDLLMFVRVVDFAGKTVHDYGRVPLQNEDKTTRRKPLEIAWGALVLAGDYRASVVLYDRTSRLRSVATRSLHVPPLHNDPLPDSWRNLPTVEFLRPMEGLDLQFHPEIAGRLWLPVTSSRPVEVE